jgi:pimeloyl-ACP methyl ester carboxylesterase
MRPDEISLPTEAAARYVELSHGRTRYFELGDGPPVLLLHGAGFLSGAHSWLPVMPALADSFRVIAPDAIGWGPGDQLESPYSFAYIVDFLREFQDALGLGATDVVGHSMGGWLTALLAYESPSRVGRMVLISAGGMAVRPLTSMVEFTAPTAPDIESRVQALGLADPIARSLVEELSAMARDETRITRFRGIMTHMSHPETRSRYHLARRLPLTANDALILWGTGDSVNDVGLGREMHRLLPRSILRTFEGAGHALPVERRGEVAAAIASFLSEPSLTRHRKDVSTNG